MKYGKTLPQRTRRKSPGALWGDKSIQGRRRRMTHGVKCGLKKINDSDGPSLLLRAVISVELLDMRGVVRSARVGPPDYMAGRLTPKAWRISLCRASGCGSLVTVVFSSTR